VPTNRKKITEETPHDPPIKDRMVATTIRFRESDLELFRTMPDLYRKLGSTCRGFIEDFTSHNGYSDIDTMRKIKEQHQVKRTADKKLYALNMKLKQNITEKYEEGKDLLKEGMVERISTDIIIDMAHDNYNRYKGAEEMSGDAELQPGLTWIKARMKDFKTIPGFDMTPTQLQDRIMKITENKQEQCDEEF